MYRLMLVLLLVSGTAYAGAKPPIPPKKDQLKILRKADETYGNQIAAAVTEEQQKEILLMLRKVIIEAKSDNTTYFTMLIFTCDVAIQFEDLAETIGCAVKLSDFYEIDPKRARTEAIRSVIPELEDSDLANVAEAESSASGGTQMDALNAADQWSKLIPKYNNYSMLQRARALYGSLSNSAEGLVRDNAKQKLADLPEILPEPKPKISRYMINPKHPWPIHIHIKEGQTIHIRAAGQWNVQNNGRYVALDDHRAYFRGCLEDGIPFEIGYSATIRYFQNERQEFPGIPHKKTTKLYLGLWDKGGNYRDNTTNKARVTVYVQ